MILDENETNESYQQGYEYLYLVVLACLAIIIAAIFGVGFIVDVIKVFNY